VSTLAAVDIGSNSARLLVWRDGDELERRSVVSRLGAGLERTGRIDDAALERTITALRGYATLLDRHGVDRWRAVATASARAASNRDELARQVALVLGGMPDVITAEEEARLAYRGAAGDLPRSEHGVLVVDIGGRSTELTFGHDGDAFEQTVSMEIGSGILTDEELPSDPPRPEELSNAIAIVHDHVEEALAMLPTVDDGPSRPTLVGVGGTITTVAAVELGLPTPGATSGDGASGDVDVVNPVLQQFVLSRQAAEDVFRTLAREPLADRVHNPGLPRARAEVIVGGCCILVGLLRRLKATELIVSVHDLLDGIVAELAADGSGGRVGGA
jgi:exopolyphosphatase/guanosine-5'-triphosphate,3'-diphosphate pyrophosphatase